MVRATGGDEYQVKYSDDENFDEHVVDIDDIDDIYTYEDGLDAGTQYWWKVRVEQGDPLLSRWSRVWTFTTKLGAVARPVEWMPANGDQDVVIDSSFGWSRVPDATTYELELADNPDFTDPITATTSINSWQVSEDLSYSTTYYWRVRALKDTLVISAWRSGAFTTMAKPVTPPPPVEILPAPPAPQITIPAPVLPVSPTPVWVWAIIGIGGALVIAVVVLIVRTRRAI